MWNDKVNIYIHESSPQCSIIHRDSDVACELLRKR